MKRTEKLRVIEGLVEKFSAVGSFYLVDAMGLTVEQVNRFRKSCVKYDLRYQVAKNTFIKKALERADLYNGQVDRLAEVLKGFSGIIFSPANGSAPAKMLKDFWREEKLQLPLLKGASVEGDWFIGLEQLDALSALKSKEEVLGDIVALLRSPMACMVAALQSGEGRLMKVMETLSSASS